MSKPTEPLNEQQHTLDQVVRDTERCGSLTRVLAAFGAGFDVAVPRSSRVELKERRGMLIAAYEHCRRGFPESALVRGAEEAHKAGATSVHDCCLGVIELPVVF